MNGEFLRILAKPAWRDLSKESGISKLSLPAIRALDSFFDHQIRHGLSRVVEEDFRAWADLGQGAADLQHLRAALELLDPTNEGISVIARLHHDALRKETSRRTSSKGRAVYLRTVSVPREELPRDWQAFLGDLARRKKTGLGSAPAPSILERMTRKLGEYIFAMRLAGMDEELHQEGLTEFYSQLTGRVSSRSGEPLRPATLRATWEELERFARLRETYPPELLEELKQTLEMLHEDEAQSSQLKFGKLHGIGSPLDVMRTALDMLASSVELKSTLDRHIQRNRAAALGLPAGLPLRREWDRLVFGKTLFWSSERYRLRNFRPQKTAHQSGRQDFPASFHPSMTPFIDALVLQDNDPKYLDELRRHVEASNRTLFVNPNGAACAKSYVSRVWSDILGTGATVTRTMMHEHFGAQGDAGTAKAMALCNQISESTARHYQGLSLQQTRASMAQDDLADELASLL